MRRLSFALLVVSALVMAACAAPAAQPTATPEPPLVSPTLAPDEPVSSTPGGEPEPGTPPYAPAPGDAQLQRGNAFVDAAQIIVAESFPPQYFLQLRGSLPTPCHQLRVAVSTPASGSRIEVDVYSVADPNASCIQALESFDVNVRLGSFPPGNYEVWVNGQPVGEIEAP